jgi:uncharacterized protein with HEPN domain
MAELSDRDAGLLADMLMAARDARSFIHGMTEAEFGASLLHQNATIRSLEIVGEAASKVSEGARSELPQIPWRECAAMRNRLIHGYREVDLERVWSVLPDALPDLISVLDRLVSRT